MPHINPTFDFSAHHRSTAYVHPEASRLDSVHGDEGLKDALKFKQLSLSEQQRFFEMLDILIADRVAESGMEKVTDVLVGDLGDELRELLTTEPVPDIDAADARTVKHMARSLNALLHSFARCMREEYEDQILDHIASER